MIFVNKEWDEIDDIIVYSNYHKYWQNKELRIKNPYFDVFSGRILDLKEGKQSAVKYFYNLINEEICKDVTICVVPSSDADKKESGIGMLGEMLGRLMDVRIKCIICREQRVLISLHMVDAEIDKYI